MNDLSSLLFYLIVGIIWVLTSLLGDRTGRRRREWEFPQPEPEPQDNDAEAPTKRPPVERIPAKWRGQSPTPSSSPTPRAHATDARRSVAATLSAISEALRTPPPQMTEPVPLAEEPAPLFAHADDLERAMIATVVLGPPVVLQSRGRRHFAHVGSG